MEQRTGRGCSALADRLGTLKLLTTPKEQVCLFVLIDVIVRIMDKGVTAYEKSRNCNGE